MSYFAVNLLLAIIWTLLLGVSLGGLLLGFVIGFVVLMLSQPLVGSGRYVRAVMAVLVLIGAFLWEFALSNLRLATDVLRRRPRFTPAILKVAIPDLAPGQKALLAALVSLTPGSISLDIPDDGSVLFVHTVYGRDAQAARDGVRAFAERIRRTSLAARPAEEAS
jgi:multicomponent Na+:H+ antiporter subunit E